MTLRAVLFDLTGTLDELSITVEQRVKSAGIVERRLNDGGIALAETTSDFAKRIEAGIRAYTRWREATGRELPADHLWLNYILPEVDSERLRPIADELTFLWEWNSVQRALRPDAPMVLAALHAAGLRLGIVSNVFSQNFVPAQLAAYNLTAAFSTVICSSRVGVRKPNPAIITYALDALGVLPEEVVFIGDMYSRDILVARRAGLAGAYLIRSPLTEPEPPREVLPNATLSRLSDLLTAINLNTSTIPRCQ